MIIRHFASLNEMHMGGRMIFGLSAVFCLATLSCEVLDDDIERHVTDIDSNYVELDEVARILASLPLQQEHMDEVYDAVSSSSGNGYDEEYTMKNLFESPGMGVGETQTRSGSAYKVPLRSLIEDHLRSEMLTKSSVEGTQVVDCDTYIRYLMESDVQIYWPYSEQWDGESLPVITYDPEDGSECNEGYRMVQGNDGVLRMETVMVDEAFAMTEPVWVVNRNSDAGYLSLEMLRQQDPSWGQGGGEIIVSPQSSAPCAKSSLRTLLLKNFTMHRNYDPWFAGASEFFVKMGSVEDFTASTEAELRLYSPAVTDFMIVVRRDQVGIPQPFNAILVSDWSDQLTHCALMITEDDGGTRSSWKCSAIVKVKSKSYGFDIDLPINSRDDVVWRGQISRRWFEENNNVTGHFGDVDLTFEM